VAEKPELKKAPEEAWRTTLDTLLARLRAKRPDAAD
jgi:hypothetical protein